MIIAIPQINYSTGDIQGNSEKIIRAIQKAQKAKAELIVFPELAICGAMPLDFLEREDFIHECRMAIDKIALSCTHIAAVIGGPNLDSDHGIMYNSAYFIQNGEVIDGVHKNILSDYDIFCESRYFIAGEDNGAIRYKNQNIRIIFDEYEAEFIEKNDSFVIFLGVTPFSPESNRGRQQILSALAQKYAKNIIAVNHCGGATSVLFDGNSSIHDHKGKLVCKLSAFAEDFCLIDTERLSSLPPQPDFQENRIALIHRALVFGIRDYFQKHGFAKAVLGLSGGIDSAVVATLAAEALGPRQVLGLLMPSCFSTDHSVADARKLAENIKMPYEIIPIRDIYDQYMSTLRPLFLDRPFNVAEENIQARIRGMLVMSMSNKFGYIPLNTSNKSELAVGYGTLYGDMCGSLSVIGDVYKTEVYLLARYLNRESETIPENTITKAPSAELRPDQKDEDFLPEYSQLDAILKKYMEENLSAGKIVSQGYSVETVNKIIGMVNRNEYKRSQCPPILKVSAKAFGIGRKYPF